MTLKEKFIQSLKSNGLSQFSTKDALDWYQRAKVGSGRVYYSNCYSVLIYPLLRDQKIISIGKGRWALTSQEPILVTDQIVEEAITEDEEFDRYLREKMRG